jgi:ribosomal protein L16/L10AE
MGKGKGAVEYWAAVVKPGIMFEVGGSFVSCRGVTSCGSKASS